MSFGPDAPGGSPHEGTWLCATCVAFRGVLMTPDLIPCVHSAGKRVDRMNP